MEKGKKSILYLPKYPQQNTFEFNEGIIFDSKFDSGNLLSVNQITDKNYELFICADCEFNQNLKSKNSLYRVWFHFSIETITKNTKITITITNLSKLLKKILSEGYTPVIKYEGKKDFERIDKTKHNFYYEIREVGVDLSMTLDLKKNERIYLSFSYTYSYKEIRFYIKSLQAMDLCDESLYFCKETLTHSLENRKIYLLTITNKSKMTSQRQKKFQLNKHLFPISKKSRPFQFDKKYILITSRVHPGETPASYVLEGILNFLFQKNEIVKNIMDNYVFLIIPCLNPDGVFYGNYRLDTDGNNLNRVYNCCEFGKHPSVSSVKVLVESICKLKCFYGFFDLHAHNNIDAAFMFGNTGKDNEEHNKIETIPKLMSMRCEFFSLENCAFKPKIKQKKIENEENKEEENKKSKSSRVENDSIAKTYFYKMTGNPHCYTFECNYNGKILRKKNEIDCIFFTPEIFKKIGENLILTINDYDESLKKNDEHL
jgi:hypothetical protein